MISVNRTGTQSVKFNQPRQCHSYNVPFYLFGLSTRRVPLKGFKVVDYISFPFPKLLGAIDVTEAGRREIKVSRHSPRWQFDQFRPFFLESTSHVALINAFGNVWRRPWRHVVITFKGVKKVPNENRPPWFFS